MSLGLNFDCFGEDFGYATPPAQGIESAHDYQESIVHDRNVRTPEYRFTMAWRAPFFTTGSYNIGTELVFSLSQQTCKAAPFGSFTNAPIWTSPPFNRMTADPNIPDGPANGPPQTPLVTPPNGTPLVFACLNVIGPFGNYNEQAGQIAFRLSFNGPFDAETGQQPPVVPFKVEFVKLDLSVSVTCFDLALGIPQPIPPQFSRAQNSDPNQIGTNTLLLFTPQNSFGANKFYFVRVTTASQNRFQLNTFDSVGQPQRPNLETIIPVVG